MTGISERAQITVKSEVNAPVVMVWKMWTEPRHIERWNNASSDWHTPKAENDLRAGGRFLSRMEARDGSVGFDFSGTYNKVESNQSIEYTLDDDRKVLILFIPNGNITEIIETFEAENVYPAEMQQAGWQSILNNFKKYVEESIKSQKL
jgi:uncharacterized protein YndB with AHSA1/START domain